MLSGFITPNMGKFVSEYGIRGTFGKFQVHFIMRLVTPTPFFHLLSMSSDKPSFLQGWGR